MPSRTESNSAVVLSFQSKYPCHSAEIEVPLVHRSKPFPRCAHPKHRPNQLVAAPCHFDEQWPSELQSHLSYNQEMHTGHAGITAPSKDAFLAKLTFGKVLQALTMHESAHILSRVTSCISTASICIIRCGSSGVSVRNTCVRLRS